MLLFIPLLVAALVALRLVRSPPADPLADRGIEGPTAESPFGEAVEGWRVAGGAAPAGEPAADAEDVARLVPYRLSATWNTTWGVLLSERYGLPAGELWRLDVGADVRAARVEFDDAELRPLDAGVSGALGLLASIETIGSTQLLWGPRPTGSGRLFAKVDGRARRFALEPATFAVADIERAAWRIERPAAPDRIQELEGQVSELEAEVQRERMRRQERELAWYEFNRAMALLQLDDLPRFAVDEEQLPEELRGANNEEEAAEPDAAEPEPDADRAHELRVSLRALLLSQRLVNLDLLEVGALEGGSLGPVVFRLLDERGRLDGTLVAERLRLEASRAARSLTLVLEDGYELRLGQKSPFEGGTRRIQFHGLDPAAWIEGMPELFNTDVFARPDDGRWRLPRVKDELNRLLALDTGSAWYRLRGLSGVVGDELREVHLEELDSGGSIRRRLFADRLAVRVEDGGVLLVLHDGITLRGERRQAFLDGVHRIYLPNAHLAEWRAAHLPGTGFSAEGTAGEEGG
ncbi:MAG: hypothetical protein WD226_04025 [Planctomycetota bacterium]